MEELGNGIAVVYRRTLRGKPEQQNELGVATQP